MTYLWQPCNMANLIKCFHSQNHEMCITFDSNESQQTVISCGAASVLSGAMRIQMVQF